MLYRFSFPIIPNVIFYAAIFLIIATTNQLDHWRMFGVKQGHSAWKKKDLPPSTLRTDGIFGAIRHPLTSLFIITLWSHESMSFGRLWFNLLFTFYAFAGTIFEERDLVKNFGEDYLRYKLHVPAFLPRLR